MNLEINQIYNYYNYNKLFSKQLINSDSLKYFPFDFVNIKFSISIKIQLLSILKFKYSKYLECKSTGKQ